MTFEEYFIKDYDLKDSTHYKEYISKIGLKKASELFNYEGISLTRVAYDNCSAMTLTTSCMDRNEYLVESLKTWLKFPFKDIIIVDWSSKKPVQESLEESLGDILKRSPTRICIKRVDGKEYYDHSVVRNMKHDLILDKDTWVLSIDCDVKLKNNFGKYLYLTNPNKFYVNVSKRSDKGLFGTCIYHMSLYSTVGGYDEDLKYWGAEDIDFYQRAILKGYTAVDIRSITMEHIEHSNDLRVKNTPVRSIYESLAKNNYKISMKGIFQ